MWRGEPGPCTAGSAISDQFRRVRHIALHSFAVESLVRGYRQGGDVQTYLPKLALYMGHVSIVSTAYYLHFIPEIATLASERTHCLTKNLTKRIRCLI